MTSQSSAFNDKNILFSSGGRIGGNGSGDIGIYGKGAIYIKPNSNTAASADDGVVLDTNGLRPYKNNDYSLGTSTTEWSAIYTPLLAAGSDSLTIKVGTASTTFTVAKFEGSAFLPGTTSARYIGSSTSPWTTVYTKNLWSLGVITGQYGMVSHICDAGGGTAGFFKFLTLTVTGAYTNRGVQISYSGRGRLGGIIYLGFANQNGTDPALTVQYTGDATIYYIKTTTSTWDLYINKSESYDNEYFTIINPSQIISGGVTWAWQNATVGTLPAGY